MIPEIKNSKPVKVDDRIRFQCKRCGECCRHVKGAVVLDSLDGYRLSRFFGMEPKDFFEKYCDCFIIDEDINFPLYTLKVTGQMKQCIFLDKNRCTVRDARPSTCRMYPFWIEPTSTNGGINVNYCYEKKQHQCGKPIRVHDWLCDNLDEEKRAMLNEEYRTIVTLAPLLHEARKLGITPDFTESYCFIIVISTMTPSSPSLRSSYRIMQGSSKESGSSYKNKNKGEVYEI